jgi:hypothetical protein
MSIMRGVGWRVIGRRQGRKLVKSVIKKAESEEHVTLNMGGIGENVY